VASAPQGSAPQGLDWLRSPRPSVLRLLQSRALRSRCGPGEGLQGVLALGSLRSAGVDPLIQLLGAKEKPRAVFVVRDPFRADERVDSALRTCQAFRCAVDVEPGRLPSRCHRVLLDEHGQAGREDLGQPIERAIVERVEDRGSELAHSMSVARPS
jgi:hypothetical protein